MGIFSRIKGGISSKANAAVDKAIDPAKELDMAILELEDGRKKAIAELISYKTTAKQLDVYAHGRISRARDLCGQFGGRDGVIEYVARVRVLADAEGSDLAFTAARGDDR